MEEYKEEKYKKTLINYVSAMSDDSAKQVLSMFFLMADLNEHNRRKRNNRVNSTKR